MFSVLLFTVKEVGRDLTIFSHCFVSGDKVRLSKKFGDRACKNMMLVMRPGYTYLET